MNILSSVYNYTLTPRNRSAQRTRCTALHCFCFIGIFASILFTVGCSNDPPSGPNLYDRTLPASPSDLTIVALSGPERVFQDGDAFTLTATVQNNGKSASNGYAMLAFYRSDDTIINPSLFDNDIEYDMKQSAVAAIQDSMRGGYGLDLALSAPIGAQDAVAAEEYAQNISSLNTTSDLDPIVDYVIFQPLASGSIREEVVNINPPAVAGVYYYGACVILDTFHCASHEVLVMSVSKPDLQPIGSLNFNKRIYNRNERAVATAQIRNNGGAANLDGNAQLYQKTSQTPVAVGDAQPIGAVAPVSAEVPDGGTRTVSFEFGFDFGNRRDFFVAQREYYFVIEGVGGESITTNNTSDSATITVVNADNTIDHNNNRLIDIHNLQMLHNIRYNLAGTSYKTHANDTGARCGSSRTPADCIGYELVRDLDFTDLDSYGEHAFSQRWQADNINPNYAVNRGWHPIGLGEQPQARVWGQNTPVTPFSAIFEGNGFTIRNLYSRNIYTVGGLAYGLFSQVSGTVRNLTITNSAVYGSDYTDFIGTVAGYLDKDGLLLNVAVRSGVVNSANASRLALASSPFELLGYTREWSGVEMTKRAQSGARGGFDVVGGLVGSNSGTIISSNAIASVSGSYEGAYPDHIGALVGSNTPSGRIVASYAAGFAIGGDSERSLLQSGDMIGGIAGSNFGDIIANYSVSEVDGNGGADWVGGIAGGTGSFTLATANDYLPSANPTIAYSYSNGVIYSSESSETSASAEDSEDMYQEDCVGGILGNVEADADVVQMSYAFSQIVQVDLPLRNDCRVYNGEEISGVSTVADLTALNSGWTSGVASGAWAFGVHDAPALQYVDYEHEGIVDDYCSQIIPNNACSDSFRLPNQPIFDHGNALDSAFTINDALRFGSRISISAAISSVRDSDYFRITVSQSGKLTIESIGSLVDLQGMLYTSDRTLLEQDDNDGEKNNFRISRFVSRGDYYIRAYSGTNQSGSYLLRISLAEGR